MEAISAFKKSFLGQCIPLIQAQSSFKGEFLDRHCRFHVSANSFQLSRPLVVCSHSTPDTKNLEIIPRRSVLGVSLLLLATSTAAEPAHAVSTAAVAGRLPGLSAPDENGLLTYRRPDGKSGGHGIGWSELIPYSFKVSDSWEEVPVSIADLGGTEIDLRFNSKKEGSVSVVVAPVLRFKDGLGDDVHIESIGPPDRVIYAFGPELTGGTVEGKVKSMNVKEVDGRTYYEYELDPHFLVSATAAGNRLYILTVNASSRQWKKYSGALKDIASSFKVG